MLKSIATVCLSGSLPEKLEAIATAGFTGVEIFENDLLVSDLRPQEIRQRMQDLGLVCTCYQPFRDFEGLSGHHRTQAFERARQKFELMNIVGADLMLVCSSLSPHASGDRDHIADDFAELGELARAHNIRVGYEALAWGRHIHDHRQAWDVVRQVNHPNIGLILDTFHSLSRDIPIDSLKDIDMEKLFLVQLADAPMVRMDYLYWSRHFRCFPGQGHFDITGFVSTLRDQGYTGPLSHEIFNDRFRSWSPAQIARDGYRSLVWLEDKLKPPFTSPHIPPPVRPEALKFIEFAASGAEAEDLKRLIGQLGFSLSGIHLSKPVTRWQQGDIDILINEDTEGFAYAYQVTHGASVCALGLSVSDPVGAVERASALGIADLSQPTAQGELNIPAVRAIGGTLIYFIDAHRTRPYWTNDFAPVQAPVQTSAPDTQPPLLTRIDHIAQSMPIEEFLSWQLYYTALFDVTRTPSVDIIDPLGLVQSLAIESPDKVLRVTLNGGSGQTLASRFVSHFFGSGIQHIAFSTPDIFALAERLKHNGIAQLELPENYYDDLGTRFDLSPEHLSRLKACNILYDEDDQGVFYQLYSRAFKRRFFFEVVQRVNYAGYGAANAPVRLAAQARHAPVTL